MQSMANAKKYTPIATLIIVLFYVIFLQCDRKLYFHNISKKHIVNNIIFGGSNAMNSISARQLSTTLGSEWYNASMSGEMENINTYSTFISKIASKTDANNINNVVYSSVLPYIPSAIASYTKSTGANDNTGIGIHLRPSRLALGYINDIIKRNDSTEEGLNNNFGDYSNNTANCFFDPDLYPFKTEKAEVISKFLIERAAFLASHFGNAHIYMVLPSMYHGKPTPEFSEFKQILQQQFNNDLLLQAAPLKERVSLVIQPQYPSDKHICNDGLHAVPLGRTWRTTNLISFLQKN